MEHQETRSALFTVRDAEDALVRFTLLLLAILIGIFLHEILLDKQVWRDALYTVCILNTVLTYHYQPWRAS